MPRVINSDEPVGKVISWAGPSSLPDGYLECNGASLSTTAYPALFAVLGYSNGGSGSSFNLPDYRWTFLRGHGPNISATGSGTASSNNSTFTSHGFNRSGIKVRLLSGTLSGIAANTDYWVIVIDNNTLAFASTKDNATNSSPVKISISGANSAVITQWEDPDASSRKRNAMGGNSGINLGSHQDDAIQAHRHRVTASSMGGNQAWNGGAYWASADGASGPGYKDTDDADSAVSDTTRGPTRLAAETRIKNVYVKYLIKY